MRNLKKFLALVLAMMMVFSLMVTANAATFDDSKDVTAAFNEAVEVLAGTGVMVGDGSGNFNPAGQLHRSEAVTIVYHILTGDVKNESQALTANYGNFSDVPANAWYAGYVGYCTNAGIVLGTGDGKFSPDGLVTGYEMLAWLLRAAGYKETMFSGTDWRLQVASGATQLGILQNVNNTNSAALSEVMRRDTVAEVTFQAMQLPVCENGLDYKWTANAAGNLTVEKNKSLAEKWFGLKKVTGIVVGNQATGEDYTMLGVNVNLGWDSTNSKFASADIDGVSYLYATEQTNDLSTSNDNGGPLSETNATLSFDLDTGIEKFGRKVDIWYDHSSADAVLTVGDDSQGNTIDVNYIELDDEFGTVYCAVDQSTASAVVYDAANSVASTTSGLGKAVSDAGFSGAGSAYESDAYGQITQKVTGNAVTNTFGNSGVYLLVSNSAKKSGKFPVNVIVALNASVQTIDKKNDYTNPKDVTLVDSAGTATRIERSIITSGAAASVATDNILVYGEDSIKVGADVVVNKINGTSQVLIPSTTPVNVVSLSQPGDWYGIDKVTEEVSGKVTSIATGTGKVTLDGGKTLEQSALFNVASNIYATNNASMLLIGAKLTFVLDGYGKYLGVYQDTNTPIMGAYGYWEQSGTSTIKYYIQGVTQKGLEVKEEIDQDTYQAMFTTPATKGTPENTMPFLSTTVGDDGQSNDDKTTSLGITKAGDDTITFGYDDLVVTDKATTPGSAGWNSFTATTDVKRTLTKTSTRFAFQGDTATYFLRDDTVYHVVSGYGDTLKIEHFTGLTALLQGADSIEFNGYFFTTEDDTEHQANKNYVVGEALLVNVKRISMSSFFFNYLATNDGAAQGMVDINTLLMTVDGKAIQHNLYVAGQDETSAILVSKIGTSATTDGVKNTPTNQKVLTTANTFYQTSVDADGYNELRAQVNSMPAGPTYAYYSSTSATTDNVNDQTNGALAKGNTAFGEIKFMDDAGNNTVINAENAKVIDLTSTAKTNGISNYETLRRAAEENEIQVAVLVTSLGGKTASVVYVTGIAVRQ